MYIRSEEQVVVLAARSNSNNISSSISDGFRIFDPDDLKVECYTIDSFGNIQFNEILTTDGLDELTPTRGDGNAAWRHVAFSYDSDLGVGLLYMDGEVIGSSSATLGSTLYWGNPVDADDRILSIGYDMDGYNFSKTETDNGFIDEVRIIDESLSPENLLIPESRHFALILGILTIPLLLIRRERFTGAGLG
jgi:hypothetical protein